MRFWKIFSLAVLISGNLASAALKNHGYDIVDSSNTVPDLQDDFQKRQQDSIDENGALALPHNGVTLHSCQQSGCKSVERFDKSILSRRDNYQHCVHDCFWLIFRIFARIYQSILKFPHIPIDCWKQPPGFEY